MILGFKSQPFGRVTSWPPPESHLAAWNGPTIRLATDSMANNDTAFPTIWISAAVNA